MDVYPERLQQQQQQQLGQLCEYCMLKNFDGTSIVFTDWAQYEKHVLKNHPSYSIYAFDDDLQRFTNSLPFGNDYQKKLADKMKQRLTATPVRESKAQNNKTLQLLKSLQQLKIDQKRQKQMEVLEWIKNH
jgi:hypothetical protein